MSTALCPVPVDVCEACGVLRSDGCDCNQSLTMGPAERPCGKPATTTCEDVMMCAEHAEEALAALVAMWARNPDPTDA